VVIVDIAGFTEMTVELMKAGNEGAEILNEIIERVFTPSMDCIYGGRGFVSSFAGDAFTAIFDHERSSPLQAVAAAVQIQNVFNARGLQSTPFGPFRLAIKIGVASGRRGQVLNSD